MEHDEFFADDFDGCHGQCNAGFVGETPFESAKDCSRICAPEVGLDPTTSGRCSSNSSSNYG